MWGLADPDSADDTPPGTAADVTAATIATAPGSDREGPPLVGLSSGGHESRLPNGHISVHERGRQSGKGSSDRHLGGEKN